MPNAIGLDIDAEKSPWRGAAERRSRLSETEHAAIMANVPRYLFRRTRRRVGTIEAQLEERGGLVGRRRYGIAREADEEALDRDRITDEHAKDASPQASRALAAFGDRANHGFSSNQEEDDSAYPIMLAKTMTPLPRSGSLGDAHTDDEANTGRATRPKIFLKGR